MTVNLGMLGMVHPHAHGIIRQIAAHPDEFRLLGAFDPDPNVAADRARVWNAAIPELKLFSNAEELLDQPLDGLIVEGQIGENLRWAQMAVDRGFSVMLEKPAGTDLAAFRRLVDSACRRQVHLQMIYLFRYMSAVQEMFKLAREGVLGRIYEFRARIPKDLALYDQHVREYAHYPGGIFFEMAGHLIDMMVTILGRPKSVTPFMGHHHHGPDRFVDNGLAVFEYDQAWGIVEVTALESAPDARRIEVYGTEGAALIPNLGSGHLANAPTQTIEVYRSGEPGWARFDLPAATLQIADLREMAACIRGEKTPQWSLDHDLVVQEMLLAAVGQ
jgi:predicted dehydrogenase